MDLPGPRNPHTSRYMCVGIPSRPQDAQYFLSTLDIPDPKVILQLAQRPHDEIAMRENIALAARDKEWKCQCRVLAVIIERE